MAHDPVRERFQTALEALVEHLKTDRTVLAALLCGSLSHDTVWQKSDIDLVLITIDDLHKPDGGDISIDANGVNVHAMLMPRTSFRRVVEGARHNSFMHAFFAKGRLLFSHDPSIAELCDGLAHIGSRDLAVQLLQTASSVIPCLDKARKWLVTRGDLDYTSLWILYAATPLARLEVLSAGQIADREVIPQASRLNPSLFRTVYHDLLNTKKTRTQIDAALDAIDAFLEQRAASLFGLVVEHLREVGDARSSSEIDAHFKRHFDVDCVGGACEYLADKGLIGQASAPVRLTKKSQVLTQELAYFYLRDLD
jgi:uncharacterized protein